MFAPSGADPVAITVDVDVDHVVDIIVDIAASLFLSVFFLAKSLDARIAVHLFGRVILLQFRRRTNRLIRSLALGQLSPTFQTKRVGKTKIAPANETWFCSAVATLSVRQTTKACRDNDTPEDRPDGGAMHTAVARGNRTDLAPCATRYPHSDRTSIRNHA